MRSVVCSILVFSMVACGSSGGSDSAPTNYRTIPADGIFTDPSNDTTVDFIDITGAALKIDSNDIIFEITLRNLPTSLTFNQANIVLNSLEYKWAVEFDIDNDNVSDYSISLMHFKFGSNMVQESILGGYTQEDVWVHDTSGTSASYLVAAQSSLTGNTIKLSVAKSANPELANITSSAKVKITTFYASDNTTTFIDSI